MIVEHLFHNADRKGEEVAIIDDRGQYTWRQLAGLANGLSLYLAQQTARPTIGILLPSSAGFVATFYAVLLAGKTAVPINFLLSEKEVGHILQDSGIDTVVTIPLLAEKLKGLTLKIVDLTTLPPAPGAIVPKLPTPAVDDRAVLLYTSGTSSMPKGVTLTYGNLHSDIENSIEHAQLKQTHSFLGIVPLFHSTGLLATMLAPMRLGCKTVYVGRFSPVATIKAIREHQLSILVAVPSMYGALIRLKDASPEDFQHVYAALSGGEPLPGAIREAFEARFNKPLLEGYGLTETIGPISFNVPEHRKPGSVGRAIPSAEIRIVDENGLSAVPGEIGEVWLRGPMIMKGYHNLPAITAEVLTTDGYFKTGDLGRLDSEGYLHITGRKKEMIIVAGEKAFPREIEDTLMQHPSVSEAAAVGKADASRGEVVVAFVILKEGTTSTAQELRDFCRDQALAQWKCPREITIVTDLPRSPTGKVLKRVLAQQVNG